MPPSKKQPPPPPYQINGEQHLLDWIVDHPDDLDAMVAFTRDLATEPETVNGVVKQGPHPMYIVGVPGTTAAIVYTVIDQYKTVLIHRVETPPTTNVADDTTEFR